MKITDLRVGDYVKITEPDRYAGYIGEVINIGGENKYLTLFVTHHNTDVFVEDIRPIPITSKMLEKNGFRHNVVPEIGIDDYVLSDDYFDITIEEWSDSIWSVRYENTETNTPYEQSACCYVHQLQHFFRVCALDDFADNFKV